MIEPMKSWAKANEQKLRIYPFSIWEKGMNILVAETHNELMNKLTEMLNLKYGEDRWMIESDKNDLSICSKNKSQCYTMLRYENRNDKNKTMD
jgi:hypothetical protein